MVFAATCTSQLECLNGGYTDPKVRTVKVISQVGSKNSSELSTVSLSQWIWRNFVWKGCQCPIHVWSGRCRCQRSTTDHRSQRSDHMSLRDHSSRRQEDLLPNRNLYLHSMDTVFRWLSGDQVRDRFCSGRSQVMAISLNIMMVSDSVPAFIPRTLFRLQINWLSSIRARPVPASLWATDTVSWPSERPPWLDSWLSYLIQANGHRLLSRLTMFWLYSLHFVWQSLYLLCV